MNSPFGALGLSPSLQSDLEGIGFSQPTPIQAASIPVLLAGKDLIGQSKTGSGKTAAFALPILQGIELSRRQLQALVLCPTRELSAQVARELRRLGRGQAGLAVLELVGGQPSRPQREALERGVHVAVGTPGRLLDHLQRDFLDPREVRTLVLDEADRMLDMGFGEEVRRICRGLPGERQTALFSATFPEAIEALCGSILKQPVRVDVADPEAAGVDIRQLRLDTKPDGKLAALVSVLQRFPHESALVFCNFKASVAELTQALRTRGVSADRLDGDLEQFHRDQVLACFRGQSVRVLVATDVAGRGIDVEGLDLVVNFELPQQPEVYVHRIGRTGRAGKSGLAVSLVTDRQDERIAAIEGLTGIPMEVLPEVPADRGVEVQLDLGAKMRTIRISGGRKDKVRPGDILGALTGEAGGLQGSEIGKIEVGKTLTYVAVGRSVARRATERLNAGRIKGKRFRSTLIS